MTAQEPISTRPYLIRAMHEWCIDNGLTPYVAVRVDGSVQVPQEYVKDGEIVLNISHEATNSLQLGNEFIEFRARFGGKSRQILVPVGRVVAVYARENGQGMAFPPPPSDMPSAGSAAVALTATPAADPASPAGRVVQLVVTEGGNGAGDDDGGDTPHPPHPSPAPGGTRPVLKRIK
ncbi:ClpXP protease specificity-enhancing factor [Verminephrobacter eiseniae]|uniref:ClpXP protease specificity-enhancing factor n=1 Tax=Verminephrobacter eiseniae TaxID=364317 RepID=UPI0022385E4D|nr:ClpXP protease specificity-enhancing factor [Verminephrobacter eiseniae]MCW5237200.1 ClpXP protease specificity-enhancing factor [Verminephrobacter eiseniae]